MVLETRSGKFGLLTGGISCSNFMRTKREMMCVTVVYSIKLQLLANIATNGILSQFKMVSLIV